MMPRRDPGTVGWVALAIAGLLVAVAVAYAASRLASPHVGLSGEPISAGGHLAPPAQTRKPRPVQPASPSGDGDERGGGADD